MKANERESQDLLETCRRLGIDPGDLEAILEEGLIELEIFQDRKYIPADQIQRLEMILRLSRDLGVNLPGVDVILQMRQRMIQMRQEVDQILEFLRMEISRDLREMLGEENFPLALGPGDEFLMVGSPSGAGGRRRKGRR